MHSTIEAVARLKWHLIMTGPFRRSKLQHLQVSVIRTLPANVDMYMGEQTFQGFA